MWAVSHCIASCPATERMEKEIDERKQNKWAWRKVRLKTHSFFWLIGLIFLLLVLERPI